MNAYAVVQPVPTMRVCAVAAHGGGEVQALQAGEKFTCVCKNVVGRCRVNVHVLGGGEGTCLGRQCHVLRMLCVASKGLPATPSVCLVLFLSCLSVSQNNGERRFVTKHAKT